MKQKTQKQQNIKILTNGVGNEQKKDVGFVKQAFLYLYSLIQVAIRYFFAPPIPPKVLHGSNGKVAIIGTGLTGVSAASHCVAAGFEVVIFEKTDQIGGIWSKVNESSGIQIHGAMYRFHPSVHYQDTYPDRASIVNQIEKVWKDYRLESRTRFSTPVHKVERYVSKDEPVGATAMMQGHARWTINGDTNEVFDGIIVAVGTCGDAVRMQGKDEEAFAGEIRHSSELDDLDIDGKHVVVVGSGASGIEAVEYCTEHSRGFPKTLSLIARSERWIIPRNMVFNAMLALVPGRETMLGNVPEFFLKYFFYGSKLKYLIPGEDLFSVTPVVNSEFLKYVRSGEVKYIRGNFSGYTRDSVTYQMRTRARQTRMMKADVVVLATGYKRPTTDFLPEDLLAEPYSPPNLYLQMFCARDPSILLLNAGYKEAIATVGHIHIGIYTRILLMFLRDPGTVPNAFAMMKWVRGIDWYKRVLYNGKKPAPTDEGLQAVPEYEGGQALSGLQFITYGELMLWFIHFLISNPHRAGWALYVLTGAFGPRGQDEYFA